MNTILLFAVLLFGTFLRGADPASVSYTGELTTDSPKWNRPLNVCGTVELVEGNRIVGYTVQSFNVLTTGLFNVMITVNSAQDDFDGLIFVYEHDFDPMLPDENFLGCDDDGLTTRDSFLTVSLQCGTQYFVVTTAFGGGLPEFGNFTNTISGHAGGMPVLEPLDESDTDGDGVTDVCDNCPMDANDNQEDFDGDGFGNVCDNCPMDINANQEDLDGDGDGNVCDAGIDDDGVDNGDDNCPMDVNAHQEDLDGDGIGNVCDPDIDNDGDDNGDDNCPMDVNPHQEDLDGDGIGNVCDPDIDNDGIDNGIDNCPMDVNANQEDLDGDGIGNVCDSDIDNDGIDNGIDSCPMTPLNEQPVTLKGCSINQLCPCERGWSKHELFIACIARVTTRFKNVGLITGREKREIQNKAAQSACGKHLRHKRNLY